MCTVNPARVLGEQDRLGSLAVGRQADISVLELRQGEWVVNDTFGGSLRINQCVVPIPSNAPRSMTPSGARTRGAGSPNPLIG